MIVGENDRFFLSFLFSFFSSRTYFRYGNGKSHRFVCHAIKRNTTDQYERGTSLSLLIQQFLPSPITPPPFAPPHLASNPLYLPISRRNGRINSFSLLLPRRIIFIQRGCSVLHVCSIDFFQIFAVEYLRKMRRRKRRRGSLSKNPKVEKESRIRNEVVVEVKRERWGKRRKMRSVLRTVVSPTRLVEDFEEFLLLGGNGVKYISLPLPAAHRGCNKFRRVAEGVIYSWRWRWPKEERGKKKEKKGRRGLFSRETSSVRYYRPLIILK